MVDLIKKALYTGVGLAVLTKEKAEDLVKELTQQAKLSEQEGKELFDGLVKHSEQVRNDFQAKVDEAVLTVVKRMNLATKDEVESLRQGGSTYSQGFRDPRVRSSGIKPLCPLCLQRFTL